MKLVGDPLRADESESVIGRTPRIDFLALLKAPLWPGIWGILAEGDFEMIRRAVFETPC